MQRLAEAIQEQGPIGQAGQRIVVGQIVKLRLLFHVIERERQVRNQIVEQPDFLRVEELGFPGEEHQDGYELASGRQRECGRAAESVRQSVLLPESRQALASDVVDDDPLPASERYQPDAVGLAFLHAHVEIDLPKRVCSIALHRHRPDVEGVWIDETRPRQFQQPLVDQNPAGLGQQFVAVVDAHRRRIDCAQHRMHPRQALDFLFLKHPLRHVSIGTAEAEQCAVERQKRRAVALQPAQTAIFVAPAQQYALPAGFQPDCVFDHVVQLPPIALVDQRNCAAAGQLIGRIAEDVFDRGIVVGEPSLRIDFPDPFRGGLDNAAKACFALF